MFLNLNFFQNSINEIENMLSFHERKVFFYEMHANFYKTKTATLRLELRFITWLYLELKTKIHHCKN